LLITILPMQLRCAGILQIVCLLVSAMFATELAVRSPGDDLARCKKALAGKLSDRAICSALVGIAGVGAFQMRVTLKPKCRYESKRIYNRCRFRCQNGILYSKAGPLCGA
jgi:hypothetical protein